MWFATFRSADVADDLYTDLAMPFLKKWERLDPLFNNAAIINQMLRYGKFLR